MLTELDLLATGEEDGELEEALGVRHWIYIFIRSQILPEVKGVCVRVCVCVSVRVSECVLLVVLKLLNYMLNVLMC